MRSSLFLIAVAAAPAAADRTTISATASGDVSATDNVFASTRETRQSDMSFTLRPGVLAGYEGPRATHQAFIEGEVLEFVRNSEKPSLSIRGGVGTQIQTTRFTSFSAQLEAQNGILTALSARNSPAESGPQLQPLGRINATNASADAAFSWDTGRDIRITPSVFSRYSRTDDNADDNPAVPVPTIITGFEHGGQLSIEKTWRDDSVSLVPGVSVLRLERDGDDAMMSDRLDRQINPRVSVAWRHDYNQQWSSALDAGVVYVHPYGKDPNSTEEKTGGLFTIFGGAVGYTEVWGRALLQVRRDVSPSLLIAQNTINENATLSLGLPLPWLDDSRRRQPRLVATGAAGVGRTRLLDPITSDIDNSFYLATVDVGVGYSPRPGFTYGLRYQFQYQTGDSAAEMVVPGFFRNTISFTFQIRYPNDANGGAARNKRRGGGTRADGGDLVPVGVDPVGSDVVEQAGDGE